MFMSLSSVLSLIIFLYLKLINNLLIKWGDEIKWKYNSLFIFSFNVGELILNSLNRPLVITVKALRIKLNPTQSKIIILETLSILFVSTAFLFFLSVI